jgi:hypothetical protein
VGQQVGLAFTPCGKLTATSWNPAIDYAPCDRHQEQNPLLGRWKCCDGFSDIQFGVAAEGGNLTVAGIDKDDGEKAEMLSLTDLIKFRRLLTIVAVLSICGISLAAADDLAIAGLVIGQRFDKDHLETLLQRPQCAGDQHCRGYLEIGFIAYTEVDGKNQKISKVVVTLTGEAQYRYVLKYLTGKYGEPLSFPNKVFRIGQNSIVESGIAEWHGRNGVVLRISEDEKVQSGTLILSVPSK